MGNFYPKQLKYIGLIFILHLTAYASILPFAAFLLLVDLEKLNNSSKYSVMIEHKLVVINQKNNLYNCLIYFYLKNLAKINRDNKT